MRVLAVTGSSGGHSPAMAFLDKIKTLEPDISALLVLPKTKIPVSLKGLYYRVNFISRPAISPKSGIKLVLGLVDFLKNSAESFFILLKFRPDVVVGFGTINSLPLVLWAWFFRIGTIIHEQNVLPGKASRFLGFFTDKIAVSFSETKKYFSGQSSKVVFTGNPLRKEIYRMGKTEAAAFFGLSPKIFTILVIGGSQGSHKINFSFLEAAKELSKSYNFQAIHLCGQTDYPALKDKYQNFNFGARVFNFFEQMSYAYSAADLVISRSGATTVAELAFFSLPAILVPYPYAGKHQYLNAEVLARHGAAGIIDDQDLNAQNLSRKLAAILSEGSLIEKMRSGYQNISCPQAGDLLSREVLALAKYQN